MRLVLISDTHNLHEALSVPDGDVLVHAGDFTNVGEWADVVLFNAWLGTLPHRHKLVIAGNHDLCFEREAARAQRLITNALYLEDSGTTIDGVTFYGSPWQPWFHSWAFNLPRGKRLREKWLQIPEGTDILITHGPPQGILDVNSSGEACGCADLAAIVTQRAPRVHVFGHIHEGYGCVHHDATVYVNASAIGHEGTATNAPVVIDV